MSKQFPVRGLAQLDRFLAAFPKKMQTAAYRSALVAAADPIEKEARILAPKQSGKLAKSIKKGSPRKNPDGTFSITIRPRGKHGYLGIFHEYGVLPHMIGVKGQTRSAKWKARSAARGDKNASVLKIGDEFISGVISHPGHVAHPFMRPALDLMAEQAVQAFANRIRAYMAGKTGFEAPVEDPA